MGIMPEGWCQTENSEKECEGRHSAPPPPSAPISGLCAFPAF